MQLSNLSALAGVLLVAPAWIFGGIALLGDAPGEWGRGALIAWTALLATLLAGSGLQAGGSPVLWLALLLGLSAIMLGGPPGLAVSALAAGVLAISGPAPALPLWVAGALALPAAFVAVRQFLGG